MTVEFTRRLFLQTSGIAGLSALAGCTTTAKPVVVAEAEPVAPAASSYDIIYGEKPDETFPLPAIPYKKINPRFYRQLVSDPTGQAPGTLVVDTGNHFLYLTLGNGQAMRYGVGLGRAGFAWAGRGVIQYKRQWPKWTPPVEMVARQPELQQLVGIEGSMPPGLKNPLGARALYIFQNGQDTLYRVHGSPEWWTIGKSVSSGCVRMMNQDIIDLYDRVPGKAQIVVTDLSGSYQSANLDQPAPRYQDDQGLGDDPRYSNSYRQDNGDTLEGPVY